MLDPSTPSGFAGYCIDLLDELAASLNFQYQISLSPDGRFGHLNADGLWNGVVHELMSRRADIGLGAMSVMAERENVIDFTVPFYEQVGIAIMMHMPIIDADYFRFLVVMESEVWLYKVAAFVVTSLALWLCERFSPFSNQNQQRQHSQPLTGEQQHERVFGLKESMWFCLMSLTPQGGGKLPLSMSAQCVAATWWLYAYVILQICSQIVFLSETYIVNSHAQIPHHFLVHRQSCRLPDRPPIE